MAGKMEWDELLRLPPIINIETAGRALGLGRSISYQLAAQGEFPVTVIRGKNALRVPTAEVYKLLGIPIEERIVSRPSSNGKMQDVTLADDVSRLASVNRKGQNGSSGRPQRRDT